MAHEVACSGIGLHGGTVVGLRLCPAPADHGIRFLRTDLRRGDRIVPALWDKVTRTELCTVLANEEGAGVATVEHLMAALSGCGIDNALIELDAGEVPIMDGSAAPFVELIAQGGRRAQAAARKSLEILAPIDVEDQHGARTTLLPADAPRFEVHVAYGAAIAPQSHALNLEDNAAFCEAVAPARTFGFFEQLEAMRGRGLALGASLNNAIAIGPQGAIMNPEGLRYPNEFARHKLLDAVGDLALAGVPIRGLYRGERAGHALNNRLLRALFAQPAAWRIPQDEAVSSAVPSAFPHRYAASIVLA